jgi:hypothetical protein
MDSSNTEPRPPLKTADEYDALTGWRKVYSWRPHAVKRIKRSYRRRERRQAKHEAFARLVAEGFTNTMEDYDAHKGVAFDVRPNRWDDMGRY